MDNNSKNLYQKACDVLPGGVNSPVRAFNGVDGDPIFVTHADGAFLFDEHDKAYIDYVGSYGPLILGHNQPDVASEIIKAVRRGLTYGAPTQIEVDIAEKITQIIPSIEMIRMVNSGTEATMSAIRLARAFTKRNKIIKFEGCYHGHADYLLVKAGSGALTLGHPTSPGIPDSFTQHTLVCHFNNMDSVKQMFEQYSDDIAAIIVEPVAGNMNCVPASQSFLDGLRSICDSYGSLLIFDEVMTGFRVAYSGAQSVYNIMPDLTCLGKIIGGGMPVGAFGGRRDIMSLLAPSGPVYQAGTLSGNPIAMAAGFKTLSILDNVGIYEQLESLTTQLTEGLLWAASEHNVPLVINRAGSMFGLFFNENETVTSYQQVMSSNVERFKLFHRYMLDNGIYFAPSAYEAAFVSIAHTEDHIQHTIEMARSFFKTL